jgi:hypothetical protein
MVPDVNQILVKGKGESHSPRLLCNCYGMRA